MCLKCREEITNPSTWAIDLINDGFWIAFELSLFACLLPTSEEKFVEFWILFFLFKEDLKKEKLITCL